MVVIIYWAKTETISYFQNKNWGTDTVLKRQ
jgi:hypothetical protein